MAIQLDVRESTADHALGVWKGVLLYVWRARTTRAGVEAMAALCDRAGKDGTGLLFGLVESGCTPPEGEVRTGLAKLLEVLNGKIVASAVTFDGKGFQAATIRFVATALALLARPGYPHRAFGDLGQAVAFLNREISAKGLSPYASSELIEALTALRKTPVK